MSTLRTLNDRFEPRPVTDRAEWERYAGWLRRHLAVSLGLAPVAARPPVTLHREGAREYPGAWLAGGGRVEGGGHICERAWLEALPGFYVTGNLYRPLRATGPLPVILCPHGHSAEGRLHDYDPRCSDVARCLHLANMGALVFSYDMVGYNDSCQLPHQAIAEDHAWGFSTMALQCWSSLRALDALLALPEADPTRVGVTGASGGGTQSFMLAALDERVTASAPLVMVSLTMQGGCICENAPLLRLDTTNVEIARLAAPRWQYLGSATGDWTNETPRRELPALRQLYALYGAADRVSHHQVDDGHNLNLETREHMYGFFRQAFFGGEGGRMPEVKLLRPPLRERMVWYGRPAPPALSSEAIQQLWRAQREAALAPLLASPERIRRELVPLLPHVLGLNVEGRPCRTLDRPTLSATVADGVLRLSGAPVPLVVPPEVHHAATYNPSPLVAQVWDILHLLERLPGVTRLAGAAGAGPAALLAAAVAPQVKAVEADLEGFTEADDAAWARCFATPCLRQIGGLRTVRAALAGRQVMLRNTPLAGG